MSEARWCDRGGHAFSVNDDGHETYSATRKYRDKEGTRRVEQFQGDSCGKHGTFQVMELDASEVTSEARD